MNAEDKFRRMFYSLPEKAKTELVYGFAGHHPMTLRVCNLEIVRGTQLGKRILKEFGYEDD